MADTLHLQVVDPERSLVDETVDEVQVPALDGYIGVLPGHAPLLSALMPGGLMTYKTGGVEKVLVLLGGFVEIQPGRVRVLADQGVHPADIDQVATQKEMEAALKAMNEMHGGECDPAIALEQVQRAQAKLDAVGKK